MNQSKLIILDRDGVINADSDHYIKSPQEWHPLPGSLEGIALLYQAGKRVVIATNQSGIARGFYSETTLNDIHQKMHAAVRKAGGHIDGIFYCPHRSEDRCRCRKPLPGLLEQIAKAYDCSLVGVPFVGDSLRDLEAATSVGALPILVLSGNGEKTLKKEKDKIKHIACYENLLIFAKAYTNEQTGDIHEI